MRGRELLSFSIDKPHIHSRGPIIYIYGKERYVEHKWKDFLFVKDLTLPVGSHTHQNCQTRDMTSRHLKDIKGKKDLLWKAEWTNRLGQCSHFLSQFQSYVFFECYGFSPSFSFVMVTMKKKLDQKTKDIIKKIHMDMGYGFFSHFF